MDEPVTYQLESEKLREQAISGNTPVTYTATVDDSPIPHTTPISEDSWLGSILKTVGKVAKESALPVAGGIAGAAVGTMAAPFTAGVANPVTGEMAGAAGGEWLNQKLGITDPSTAAIVMSGALPGVGRLVGSALRGSARGTPAARDLVKGAAQGEMGQILPEAAQNAKAFYTMAENSGKTAPLEITTVAGGRNIKVTTSHTFKEAQQRVQSLKAELEKKLGVGELPQRKRMLQAELDKVENQMDETWPGYKASQKAYPQYDAHRMAQSFINETDPLKSFEQALNEGSVAGPTSMLERSKIAKFLTPAEIADTKDILYRLGKAPGEEIFKDLVKGRAVGHMLGILGGGAIGMKEGGWSGATAGAMTGLVLPKVFNSMIAKGLTSPMTRAMLKGAIQSKTLNRPEFWGAFNQVLTRLGLGSMGMTPSDIMPGETVPIEGQ